MVIRTERRLVPTDWWLKVPPALNLHVQLLRVAGSAFFRSLIWSRLRSCMNLENVQLSPQSRHEVPVTTGLHGWGVICYCFTNWEREMFPLHICGVSSFTEVFQEPAAGLTQLSLCLAGVFRCLLIVVPLLILATLFVQKYSQPFKGTASKSRL